MARKFDPSGEQRGYVQKLRDRRRIKAARSRRKSLSDGLMLAPYQVLWLDLNQPVADTGSGSG